MDAVWVRLTDLVVFGLALVYLPLQIYTGLNRRGKWRVVALLPILFMVVASAISLAQGSNLWPLVGLFAAPYGAAVLTVLSVVHRLAESQARGPNR
jgi:hypothetical protein